MEYENYDYELENSEEKKTKKFDKIAVDAKKYGVTSIICAVIGFFFFGIPLGITAIITGGMACKGYETSSKALGVLGIIMGVIDIVGVIIALSNM